MADKILFTRGNTSKKYNVLTGNPNSKKSEDLIESDNLGVLVVDPNKVINDNNRITDRYVKQEDLMIYSSLKVYKKEESSIYVDRETGELRNTETKTEPIIVNFLNPLKRNVNDSKLNKGKLTSEWVDFFTSDSANLKGGDRYMADPETFGINSINISINASFLPVITIEFTDVQGRVLFERGNDKDNPYNIFFTYPYPKFLLTYKGYYGKAVETPLVLLKSNTRFDPSTGNYNITAEFQSEIFALFNSILTIYPYVAPYMYKLKDGEFLGKKILTELYEKQNRNFKKLLSPTEYKKYDIKNAPTLHDLGGSILKLKPESKSEGDSGNLAVTNNSTLVVQKKIIESYESTVIEIITNTPSTFAINPPINGEQTYRVIGGYNVSSNKPTILFDYLKTLNEAINTVSEIKLVEGENTFSLDLKNRLNKSSDLRLKNYARTISGSNFINGNIFIFESRVDTIHLDTFNSVILIINELISELETKIEDAYLDVRVNDLGDELGFQPNLNNIIRIIANNIQTFLILLNIAGKGSLNQIKNNKLRVSNQIRKTEHSTEFNNKLLTPFPNYFKTTRELINGDNVNSLKRVYPGSDSINKDWFEVSFIEEIYNGLQTLIRESNGGADELLNTKKTSLLTVFQLNQDDLTNYRNKVFSLMLAESIFKLSTYLPYSGMMFRGLPDTNYNDFLSNLARLEYSLMVREVISKLGSEDLKFTIINELKNATQTLNDGGVQYTHLGYFGIKFIGFRSNKGKTNNKTVDEASGIIKSFYTTLNNYVNKSYTQSDYVNKLNEIDKKIKNSVDRTDVYNILSFNQNTNIDDYSITPSRGRGGFNHFIDLRDNVNYSSEDILTDDGFFSVLGEISSDNVDSNIFQGFYMNINDNLKQIPISSDMGRGVSYGSSNESSALTFNKIIDDYVGYGDFTPFEVISAENTTNYHTIFNNL